jgi:hypothetical protein
MESQDSSMNDYSFSSLLANNERVIYLDFYAKKNFRETIEYLATKADRLIELGYSKEQAIEILISIDNLKAYILDFSNFKLLEKWLVEYIESICSS